MPGPYQIIGEQYTVGVPRWGQPPRCGPYEYGGNLFAFVGNAENAQLTMVKSTDQGATWTVSLDLGLFVGSPNSNPAIVFNTCKSINFETTPIIYIIGQAVTVDFLNRVAVSAVNLATESEAGRVEGGGIAEDGLTYIQFYAPNDDLYIEQASDGTLGILAEVTYLGVGSSPTFLYPRRTICMMVVDAGLSGISAPVALGHLTTDTTYNSVAIDIVRTPSGDVRGVIYEWNGAAGLSAGIAYYVDIVVGGAIGDGTLTALGDVKFKYAMQSDTSAHTFAVTSTSFSDTGVVSTFDMTDPTFSGGVSAPAEAQGWTVAWWDGDFWQAIFSNTENGFYLSSLEAGVWSPAEQIFTGWNYYLSGAKLSTGTGLIYTPDSDLTNYQAWFFMFGTGGGDCCRCLPHGAWDSGAG